jgi:hypothetical protein
MRAACAVSQVRSKQVTTITANLLWLSGSAAHATLERTIPLSDRIETTQYTPEHLVPKQRSRIEKAHDALTAAAKLHEEDDDTTARQRMVFLLDVATIQAALAQAEALQRLATAAEWANTKLGPYQPYVPYRPPYTAPYQPPTSAPTWAQRTGLDHGTKPPWWDDHGPTSLQEAKDELAQLRQDAANGIMRGGDPTQPFYDSDGMRVGDARTYANVSDTTQPLRNAEHD